MAKIAYATKVENSGATASGRISAADANEIKASVNTLYDNNPIGEFVANITQTGSGDPVLVVIKNTTGLTFTPLNVDVGQNAISIDTPPNADKIELFVGNQVALADSDIHIQSNFNAGSIVIKTYDISTNALVNGKLLKTTVRLNIYP